LSHYCTQIETEVGGAFFPSNCEGFNKEDPKLAKLAFFSLFGAFFNKKSMRSYTIWQKSKFSLGFGSQKKKFANLLAL